MAYYNVVDPRSSNGQVLVERAIIASEEFRDDGQRSFDQWASRILSDARLSSAFVGAGTEPADDQWPTGIALYSSALDRSFDDDFHNNAATLINMSSFWFSIRLIWDFSRLWCEMYIFMVHACRRDLSKQRHVTFREDIGYISLNIIMVYGADGYIKAIAKLRELSKICVWPGVYYVKWRGQILSKSDRDQIKWGLIP